MIEPLLKLNLFKLKKQLKVHGFNKKCFEALC